MKLQTIAKVGLLTSALCISAQAFSQSTDSATTTTTEPAVSTTTTDTTATTTTTTPSPTTATGVATETTGTLMVDKQSTDVANRDLTPEEDSKITSTVKHLIEKSKLLAPLKIEVVTQNGVVSLSGNVDSDSEASLLVAHAESVIGVKDVNTSNLTVKKSSQPLADTMTTAKIKGLFIREKLFGEKDISAINTKVETKDGVVYLTGHIDNKQQIDNAIDIIKKHVPEVKKVEYNVEKFVPNSASADKTANTTMDTNTNNNMNQTTSTSTDNTNKSY